MPDDMLPQIWVELVAGGCVAVYAWERFSTPGSWRSTTTRWQWNVALFGYVAAAVALWWVLMKVIATNPDAARFIMFGADPEAVKFVQVSAPFAAALFLTALLPHLPLLKKLDAGFRTIFRELGAIPRRARQLSAKVRSAEFAVPPQLLREVGRELASQQLSAERLMAADPHSPAWEWVRIVTLKTRLGAELAEPEIDADGDEARMVERSAPFVEHRLTEYRQIMASYRRLASLAGIVLAEPGAHDGDALLKERHDGLLKTFEEDSAELFRGLGHFVSCYLLSTQFGMRAAIEALESWGLRPRGETVAPLLRWHDLVGLALLTMAYMYGWFEILGGGMSSQKALMISVMIGASMAAAALMAGVPGMLARRRGSAPTHGLSFGFYALAGLLAALCWGAIFYLRLLISDGASFSAWLAELETKFPFMLLPAGAAFSIALLVDLDLRSRFGPERLGSEGLGSERLGPEWLGRIAEGACLAVAMGAIGYFVGDQLADLAEGGRSPDPVQLLVVQAGLGALLGSIVPSLYRRARLRTTDGVEQDAPRGDGSGPLRQVAAL